MNYYIFETKFSNSIATPISNTFTYDDFNNISSDKYSTIDPKFEFKIKTNKKLTPVLNPSSVGFYFVESIIAEQLKKSNISGIKLIPSLIKNEKNQLIEKKYYILSISSTSDEIDYSKSIFHGDGFGSGIFINNINLIKSDVFRPSNSLYIIVNENFKEIVENNSAKNVIFTNIKDVKFPEFLIKQKINK